MRINVSAGWSFQAGVHSGEVLRTGFLLILDIADKILFLQADADVLPVNP